MPSVYEPSFGCSVKAGALGVDFLAATPSRDTKIILLRNRYDVITSLTFLTRFNAFSGWQMVNSIRTKLRKFQ